MKVVICYKLVPEVSQIKVRSNKSLDLSPCEWSISQYDLNAVEAAAELVRGIEGSSLIALTAGGSIVENSKLRKAILARGPQELKTVCDESIPSADCYCVSGILADAIRKIGDVDLVIFGEGSGDVYAQQTGSMVGAMLGWNTVNSVSCMKFENGNLIAERTVEECTEKLQLELPAAISVTSDICLPRITSMRDILQAGKKPFEQWSLSDLGSSAESKTVVESILAPDQADRLKIVGPESDEAHIDAVVSQLRTFI